MSTNSPWLGLVFDDDSSYSVINSKKFAKRINFSSDKECEVQFGKQWFKAKIVVKDKVKENCEKFMKTLKKFPASASKFRNY